MKPSARVPKHPDDRQSILVHRRNLKMARSAQAYVRGSTSRFYEWLKSAEGRAAPEGPPIWICGDCHLGNLGPVANVDGGIAIQIRDLDSFKSFNCADSVALAPHGVLGWKCGALG
jgi:uncharacterized protein (DUF2252 family)